jgi:ABC-type phosphate transport system ATPase subunit
MVGRETGAAGCHFRSSLAEKALTFIGPSGCSKAKARKCLNRVHDGRRAVRIEGRITLQGQDSMVPKSICPRCGDGSGVSPVAFFENLTCGARIHGLVRERVEMKEHVEDCLRRARV